MIKLWKDMRVKVFPARVNRLGRIKTNQIELALLNAPKASIAKLHGEARQFEYMIIARHKRG